MVMITLVITICVNEGLSNYELSEATMMIPRTNVTCVCVGVKPTLHQIIFLSSVEFHQSYAVSENIVE